MHGRERRAPNRTQGRDQQLAVRAAELQRAVEAEASVLEAGDLSPIARRAWPTNDPPPTEAQLKQYTEERSAGQDFQQLQLGRRLIAPRRIGLGLLVDTAPQGTVKFFDPRKGYGFIARERDTDVFVHKTAIEASGLRLLETGQRVAFDLEPGRNGQEAHRLRLL